jgi:hypothetical protein
MLLLLTPTIHFQKKNYHSCECQDAKAKAEQVGEKVANQLIK